VSHFIVIDYDTTTVYISVHISVLQEHQEHQSKNELYHILATVTFHPKKAPENFLSTWAPGKTHVYRKIGLLSGGRWNKSLLKKSPEKFSHRLSAVQPHSAHRVAQRRAVEGALERALGGPVIRWF
jgi:hypothetical protein